MRVEYVDDQLRRLAEDRSFRPTLWEADLIRAYRKRIQSLHAAKNDRDLRALRGLRLERAPENREDAFTMRLNDDFRLILTFKIEDCPVAVVLKVAKNHQRGARR